MSDSPGRHANDYFARVRPLFGDGLSKHVVAVDGDASVTALTIELLASCMLEHVVGSHPGSHPASHLGSHPGSHPGSHLGSPADVRIADARIVGRRGPAAIEWREREVVMTVEPDDVLAYVDVSYHVARALRDALLDRAPWPTTTPAQPFDPRGIEVDLRGKHVMIIGCGSLGSEALRMLATSRARFTLVDDAHVTVFNLARQWFDATEVGRLKVGALCDRLRAGRASDSGACDIDARAWPTKLDASELPVLEARLRDDPPDVVLLATGTHHHAMIAELLWRLGIPHVAACCYPQARYFEVSIVSPRERTPCLHCFRGHLYRGTPDEPITDEVAAFLYQPVSDAERARRYMDLVAEPASKIETIRAAHVLARCAVELVGTRTPWFRRVLAEETTCLLGGNVAGAHGITTPGQVVRLGVEDIAGTTDSVRCDVCVRTMRVALRDEISDAGDLEDALHLTLP